MRKTAKQKQCGTSVNHILKGENDISTIGLLICKTKDNILAKYASESSNKNF